MHPPRLKLDNQVYFLTICTFNRIQYFLDQKNIEIVSNSLCFCCDKYHLKIYAWVILPEHLHLFLGINKKELISKFLNAFKGFTAYTINKYLQKHGSIWQEGSYDHVVRNEKDFKAHYDYIHFNPVKHKVVLKPEDYRFSSYHEALKKGYYNLGWGYSEPENLKKINKKYFGE